MFIGQVVRVAVDENSPVPRNPSWPDSVQVKSDIGQAVVCDRVVLFRRLGKLVHTRDNASEKRLHLLRGRADTIQVNIVAPHLGALTDGVALIGDGVHQRESSEDSLDDSVFLIESPSGFDRDDSVLTIARSETHHRMSQIWLRGEWHNDELGRFKIIDFDSFRFVVFLVAAVALIAKVAKVLDCLLYTSPSPRDATLSRMPSSA